MAAFSGTPTSGTVALTVSFTDQSTNSPTSWAWNFGDSGTSTAQNPSHTYTTAGTYTVTLTATNSGGSDPETKTNYITVSSPVPPPVAAFSGTPTSGTAPLTVSFTDHSTNSPTSWSWTFGDGGTSTAAEPEPHLHDRRQLHRHPDGHEQRRQQPRDEDELHHGQRPPDFSLSAANPKMIVVRGNYDDRTLVSVSALNGFTGTVGLSVSGLPAGATGSSSPTSITVPPTGSSTLTVPRAPTMKVGTYTLTIRGTSGPITHSTTVTLQVKRK